MGVQHSEFKSQYKITVERETRPVKHALCSIAVIFYVVVLEVAMVISPYGSYQYPAGVT